MSPFCRPEHARIAVRHVAQHHLVDIGQRLAVLALAPVVRVGDEHDLAAALIALDHEGPGADGLGAEGLGAGLVGRLLDHRGGEERQRREDRRVGLLQHDLDRLAVDDLRPTAPAGRRSHRPPPDPSPCCSENLTSSGVTGEPSREVQPVAQREGPGEAVGRGGPGCGESRHQAGAVGIGRHQAARRSARSHRSSRCRTE